MNTQRGRRLAEGRGNGGAEQQTNIQSSSIIPRSTVAKAETASAVALGADPSAMSLGKLLFTVDEAAELLSLSRAHLYRLLQRGELASVSSGRTRRISRAALESYVARIEEEVGL